MTLMPGAEPFTHDGNDIGVLVCHGYCSTPQSMREWAQHLAAAGYTVRLPRLPGMGTRWQDLNETTWQDWYGELDREYQALAGRCRRVFAVGLSLGGLLATKIALEHPLTAGIVLVNPIFAHDNPALRVLPLLRHVVPSLPGIIGDIAKPGAVELGYDRNPLKAMYSQTQLWRIVVDDLPQLRTPVLLLHSREDHVVPPLSRQVFLSRIASTDVTTIELLRSHHVATLDHDAPLIFEQSVAFIERLSSERR